MKRGLQLSSNLEADTGGGDVRVARLVQVGGGREGPRVSGDE